MDATSSAFRDNSRRALADERLQEALHRLADGFPARRREAIARLPEFDQLRARARAVKDHVLDNLDGYLERFAAKVEDAGGHVHWCRDAAEARQTILKICRDAGARTVTKSKSMVGEEIAINQHLEAHGIEPVETDLGEYIIQLRREAPSHLIAPAIHLSKDQVSETFKAAHGELPAGRPLDEPRAMLDEARTVMRKRFLAADVGITGANMLIAETGTVVVVTNEGNADLTMTLPKVHIAVTGIEKVVPTLDDAMTQLRILTRSATGQEVAVYTTFVTGPRRDMLRCIRCGACLNHCPVYSALGGHAYGWVYSGPMGSVLTPGLIGIEEAHHLPNASTFCGACEEVCPMGIPLPKMLRHWRQRAFDRGLGPGRAGIRLWAFVASRPRLYRAAAGAVMAVLGALGRRRGRFRRLPLAGGWTAARDLAASQGPTFLGQCARRRRGQS
ncbi:MAG: lactate utilization protein B [Rhodospirillales bacterium]|nr:lactate utilization protein B [Rhodospirillales bacterium]